MKLFRESAVKKVRSPEQLDSLLSLTTPRAWLALAVLGLLIVAICLWSVFGRVPVRVQGLGIILSRDTAIYDIPASGTGIITSVSVTLGDRVDVGDRIAAIALPDLEAELAGAQATLATTTSQRDTQKAFAERDITRRGRDTDEAIVSLEKQITDTRTQLEYLNELFEEQSRELELGYVTRTQVEETRVAIFSAEQAIQQARTSIADTRTAQIEFENERQQEVVDLDRQVIEAENQVRQIKASLDLGGLVLSPVSGIVSELDVRKGTRIEAGESVAVVRQAGEGLEIVGFFEIGAGKKLAKGMEASVSPASIERDLYGSIEGRIQSISDLPETESGLFVVLGNRTLAEQMMAEGAPIRATVELLPDPETVSGLRWTSSKGPPLEITPGDLASIAVTVREERPIDLVIPIFETWITGGQ